MTSCPFWHLWWLRVSRLWHKTASKSVWQPSCLTINCCQIAAVTEASYMRTLHQKRNLHFMSLTLVLWGTVASYSFVCWLSCNHTGTTHWQTTRTPHPNFWAEKNLVIFPHTTKLMPTHAPNFWFWSKVVVVYGWFCQMFVRSTARPHLAPTVVYSLLYCCQVIAASVRGASLGRGTAGQMKHGVPSPSWGQQTSLRQQQ